MWTVVFRVETIYNMYYEYMMQRDKRKYKKRG